jgi:hypothetical protein
MSSSAEWDWDWLRVAKTVSIFAQEPLSGEIRLQKSDHLQFYFWTALDRSNRRFKDTHAVDERPWEFHDMRGMMKW